MLTHRRWCSTPSDTDHGHECVTRPREIGSMVIWLADTPSGPMVYAEQQALIPLGTVPLLKLTARLPQLALLQLLVRAQHRLRLA